MADLGPILDSEGEEQQPEPLEPWESSALDEMKSILEEGPDDFQPASMLDCKLWVASQAEIMKKDCEFIRKNGITHILNCAGEEQCKLTKLVENVQYHVIDAEDDEEYNMLQHYDEAEQFITSGIQAGGKVVVHCGAGVNRSVTLCVAYMVAHEGVNLMDAIIPIRHQRRIILLNPAFRRQLVNFAKKYDKLPNE
eukprot:TRINITY_DN95739_c0_g1_i1.p1 TRINITY_DN95739_c0_g1~~TRINITY_DN95739_c0_g1_i1.p1  ORF type:complete len:203 (+),score=18.72 TRINITY_DN95739_c0_g1_i1:26-610(+)